MSLKQNFKEFHPELVDPKFFTLGYKKQINEII